MPSLTSTVTAIASQAAPSSQLDALATRPTLSPLELLLKYDRPVPRYTSYPTASAFSTAVGAGAMATQLATPASAPLSLYVHVPFCRHACWYCGCNRITTQLGSKVVAPYLLALARELELVSAQLPQRRHLAQLHWGGGTPNYLNNGELAQLWDLIAQHFDLDADLEASIELNPELVDREQIQTLRHLGFNRISFGIQDADPQVQAAVNRVVPVEQLRRAMAWIREADFQSVNVDLICGLPLQTPERFQTTLELVRELRPDRISLFSFAYLPEQLPLQRQIAAADLPDQHQRLAMLDNANRLLLACGYDAIGMDHYALSGDSLAIAARQGTLHRNFQGYTTGGDLELLGVGPTAISQFHHLFAQNHRDLKAYYQALEAGQLPVERGLEVRDQDVLERRALIRALMCQFTVELPLADFQTELGDLQALAADGLVQLEQGQGRLKVNVTTQGRWLIRTIAAVFDPLQRLQASGSRLV